MITIPKEFTILRQTEDMVEIKSKYHYWMIISISGSENMYLLAHKHQLCDKYHKQKLKYGNPTTANVILSHIKAHDNYIDAKIKEGSGD